MKLSKERFRDKYKLIRNRLSQTYRNSANQKIFRNFFKLLRNFPQIQNIGIYVSAGTEVNTIKILNHLLALKKNVAAPKVNPQNRSLKFLRLKHGLKDCRLGHYNILEPYSKCAEISPDKLELVLVPGIAFDFRGYRLGYGKGFYDRFLRKISSGLSVGLAYEKSFVKVLPHDFKDLPVQCVITEKRICWVKK